MTNYDRRLIVPADAWLLDTEGVIQGIEIAQGTQQKTYLLGSSLDGDIADLQVDSLIVDGTATIGEPIGLFGVLSTVPSGTPLLTLNENAQMVVYGPFTVESTEGVAINGEMRVYGWPA